ncbi:MAG: NAD+ synthase [Proteobacteria bacterium]|nr:NAD+ synthase [Pseudomonadota bacterium]MBU1639122.1 NAD+ synthase [Pseudomonadota bacterium]
MKIALIQINPIIGDFHGNADIIRRQALAAKEMGAQLAIFPELALCGYPPLDYLEHPSFVAGQNSCLEGLLGDIRGIAILCGMITLCPSKHGKPLHNTALLFRDGEILHASHKKLLPTYDVFDESRYFQPGTSSQFFCLDGLNLGITICEDLFNDIDAFPEQLYDIDPVAELNGQHDLDLLINIAASPFTMGKQHMRHKAFSAIGRKYGVPLLYCNQVGGQDSILFDGASFVVNAEGGLCAQATSFSEDILFIDSEALTPITASPAHEIAAVHDALVMGTRDYVRKCGFAKVLVGLSGGIDSALTCALACAALGPENVMGVGLPSPYSSQGSIADAQQLAANLGIRFELLPITTIFDSVKQSLAPLFAGYQEDVTEQNIQARIRGVLLMALANKYRALLLTTGNKSELAVGYCTLYGDMSGALAVISDVPKMLVYDLARYINRDKEIIPATTISKPPSAELAPNQKDQDDLPPYEILDPILAAYLEKHKPIPDIIAEGFDEAVVRDVVRRIKINEYKRKQAAMGLKVTSKAFGFGRRYPTAERFMD